MKLLVIPDAHAHPDLGNERFDLLANVVRAHQPDAVVCLGDWADMPSLSSYDKGTKGFEGRRYSKDVAAARDALSLLEGGIARVNVERERNHQARYRPRKVITLGNHENRISRATNANAELDGTIATTDLGFEAAGWEVHPYKAKVCVEGFWFTHNTFNDNGRERGGENLAKTLLAKEHASMVVGHSHRLDVAVQTDAGGRKMLGLVAGCFVHPAYAEQEWAAGGSHRWWSGLVLLDGVKDGWAEDIRLLSMQHLEAGGL